MIPDEAVEAAAKVLEDIPSYDHAAPDVIRMVLEAAAPYMMAEAWDEGYEVGGIDERVHWRPNPYRSSGADRG